MGAISIPLFEVLERTGDNGNGFMIGMDRYPIYDEKERDPLNRKIIDHYLVRDICVGSVPRFIHFMRSKMNEVMPMYNQLYESARLQFDPFSTYDLTTARTLVGNETAARTSSGKSASDTGSKSRTVGSNTPQVQLAGNKSYASTLADAESGTKVTNQQDGTDTSKTDTKNTDTSRTTGYQAMPSVLLAQYRATILNIDLDVINELPELFSLVWETDDRHEPLSRWSY